MSKKQAAGNGKIKASMTEKEMMGWKRQMQDLIDRNVGKRVDGRVASHRTRKHNAVVLFAGMNTLHDELGMRLQNPQNLSEKHIRRLVEHWYQQGKEPTTMRGDLSVWRKFSGWIGKPSMVKPLEYYLPNVNPAELVVSSATKRAKSWSQNGIDVEAKINQAFALNERFGLLLLVELVFGLRMKEALCLKVWKADNGHSLTVYPGDGPKGGRPRVIPYLIPEQKMVIEFVKSRVKKTHWLGWQLTRRGEKATLESNTQEYFRRMREIAITKKDADVVGHGLRAEFAENMATVKGFCPVTLGGTSDQIPYDQLNAKVAEVSEMLGHSRVQIMSSYFGPFKRPRGSQHTEASYSDASTSARTASKTRPESSTEEHESETMPQPTESRTELPDASAQLALRSISAGAGR